MGRIAVVKTKDLDERAALRQAIAEAQTARSRVEAHEAAISRAHDLVAGAEQKVAKANATARTQQERLADALQAGALSGKATKPPNMAVYKAAVTAAEDQLEAARIALQRISGERGAVWREAEQAEVRVSTATLEVAMPIAERFAAQAQRARLEARTLEVIVHDLLGVGDNTLASPTLPFAKRRDAILRLLETLGDSAAARIAAEPWRQWRAALRQERTRCPRKSDEAETTTRQEVTPERSTAT
jgi:hypothetical protein